jgi:hypothetical protein
VAQARLGVQLAYKHRLARERDLPRNAFAERDSGFCYQLVGQPVAGGDGERLALFIQ